MFREDKPAEQAQAQAASMGNMPMPGMPTYPSMPGTPVGYYPGMPYAGMQLARAYFAIQQFGQLFDYAKALETGTLFPELYRPYPY